jgi:PKHD-type hydroxylase
MVNGNKMINSIIDNREPGWKRWVVPIQGYLNSQQCDEIIKIGRSLPPESGRIGNVKKEIADEQIRKSTTAFIPRKQEYKFLYDKLLDDAHEINRNNFGFDHINIFENPQYTEYYGGGGHYSWHPDSEINGENNGIIRKISLTIQLNNPSEYEGGKFELLTEGRDVPLQKGDAVFFASFLIHRVTPVIRGTRQSLVQWFTGTPFR